MNKMRVAAILMTGLVLAAPAMAQQAAPPTATSYPEWDRLTPDQRKALVDPVRARWNENPDMREEMIKRAQHWQRMTPEQREAAHRGIRRWENLTPDQRKAMHEQWKAMSPEQRKAWLDANGPKMPPPRPRPQDHR
ncbi:MAG: DUF3106 domain-containing protein [Proteobacteria bacterium]|nr:DUF3106 domain-containing protein [Pseudomonadota bacterium]